MDKIPPEFLRRRHSITELERKAVVDVVIDLFEESRGLEICGTTSFSVMVQQIMDDMALTDKTKTSLAENAKRRMMIAQRLGLRKFSPNRKIRRRGSPKNSPKNSPTSQSPDQAITKRNWKSKPKAKQEKKHNLSQVLQAMISEVEAQESINPINDESLSESEPEGLRVEESISPFKIKIITIPGRSGGHIITRCDNVDWKNDLECRFDTEQRQRLRDREAEEKNGMESRQKRGVM